MSTSTFIVIDTNNMPQQHHPGRPRGTPNLTERQKGAILALKKFSNLPWTEISSAVGCAPTSASQAYKAMEATARDGASLPELLRTPSPPKHSGAPKKKTTNQFTTNSRTWKRVINVISECFSRSTEPTLAPILGTPRRSQYHNHST
ncbi:hypothetical protein EJ04DRAFT_217656 [Polyplosphaeria fusca]|uniref:Uncharacterized protein n=1 Tax=Polyplosphaeria fusca TaxID=682080 RepID=A0A9P4R1H7_9PLEO|nr:hypothetical protein EJ04DRAFT_217656 [Polyplosphaeria fusca]